MADDRKQLDKVIELMVLRGSAHWIHLTVLFALSLSGIVLQGLVYWYGLQTAEKAWGAMGVGVWAFAAGVWILAVGLLLAWLWKRLKVVLEGALP